MKGLHKQEKRSEFLGNEIPREKVIRTKRTSTLRASKKKGKENTLGEPEGKREKPEGKILQKKT